MSHALRSNTVKGATMKQSTGNQDESPSQRIDAKIKSLDDWRGKSLARVRALIRQADAKVVEEWKWDVPVWSQGGIICTGETYKGKVKLTFAKGAALADPAGVFNSSLEGKVRRAIDIHEGDDIDEAAFKALIRAAAALNKFQVRGFGRRKGHLWMSRALEVHCFFVLYIATIEAKLRT